MVITSFLSLLVYSTYNSPSLNRIGTIAIAYTLLIFISSFDLIALVPGLTLYNGWFNITSYNLPLTILILVLITLLLVYSTSATRYELYSPYYIVLVLSNIVGLLLFPLVNDLLALYIVIELQSYSLYLLTGLHNRSYGGTRAALLYFLMGGVASVIILVGSYFIYSDTGSTNLSDISLYYNYATSDYFDIVLVALMFKMGMAPLHRWSIAVYNYAPTYITAYISVVAKLSIVAWIYTNSSLFGPYILITFFYISLLVGAYKPLFQVNLKVILAYSGLLNFGYVLLGLMTYDISVYIYLIQYSLTHLILFLSILAASEYISSPVSTWSPLVYIHQLRLPRALAIVLVLALFSLIGIPPLPGFYAKLYILAGALQESYVLETILLVVCSVIATYYYANIIKVLISSSSATTVAINPSIAYIISISTVILLSMYLYLPIVSEALYLVSA